MGRYAADDGSIWSKGAMYFVLHPHGLNMSGRWVGLGLASRSYSSCPRDTGSGERNYRCDIIRIRIRPCMMTVPSLLKNLA